MIKYFFVMMLGFSPFVFAASNTPGNIPYGTDVEATTRIFYARPLWSLLAEVQGANEIGGRQVRSILLGGYYHIHPNLRAGLFYQRQYGFRHDEDWFQDPITGWQWRDVNGRGEDLAIADVSPKFELHFLPGENWTFEFKSRFYFNFFNQEQALHLRPNLTYFWIRDEKPFVSFFLQAEYVLPLNYGVKPNNEHWFYIGLLYHWNDSFQVGGYVARKWQAWMGNQGEATANSAVLGLLAIYKL